MGGYRQEILPFLKFLDEKWEAYSDEEDLPARRKKIAEEWKSLSPDDREPYTSVQPDYDQQLFVSDTLDPSTEKVFGSELAVYRTYYGADDGDQWWENLQYLMVYDNNSPYYNSDWEEQYIPAYENKELLDGVTPEEFAQKVIIAREDFNNMGYTGTGEVCVRFSTVVLADETTAKTGLVRMISIDEGDGKTVEDDYRAPVTLLSDFYVRFTGLGHSIDRWCIDSGLDDQEEESLQEYEVDLRGELKEVFLRQAKKDSGDGEVDETEVNEAIEEIGRMREARELMED